jgi:hypothetical protein
VKVSCSSQRLVIVYRMGIRDNTVGIPTGYGLGGPGSIHGSGKIFLFSTTSTLALGSTQAPIHWVAGAHSPGVKRQVRETDHSPPPSTEVKNGGARPSLPHTSSWHVA